ncbi:RT0821/Lpp0805 family surface protein [Ciceribacter azotifigens]|uniref:RT0821/Lpp0805 family surface protein n=1 Tax=Ciceribacter azotifigens TaxID=2069303 RepID=UPI003A8B6445
MPGFGRIIAVALLVLPLTGCLAGGLDLFGDDKVDRSIATGTVAGNQANGGSDEMTVQNAVSSADLSKLGSDPLPWANASTGSAGVVTTIREQKQGGFVCRDFSTTRHSYEGIAYFSGKTCAVGPGWRLMSFDRQS